MINFYTFKLALYHFSMKFSIILFFFLGTYFQTTDDEYKRKIDELLHQSDHYVLKDNLKSLGLAKEANNLAEEFGEPEYKIKTYLYVSKCLNTLEMYKESIVYAEKGLNISRKSKNLIYNVYLHELKAANYTMLGFYELEVKEYQKVLALLKRREDFESKRTRGRIYARMSAMYLDTNQYAEALYYINLALKINEKFTIEEKDQVSELGDLYNIKGVVLLKSDRSDSAVYYFRKHLSMIGEGSSKYVPYKSLGDYHFRIGDFENALEFYLKVLNEMEKHNIVDNIYQGDTFKSISEIYGKLGDEVNSTKYLNLSIQKKNLIDKSNVSSRHIIIKEILNEKKQNYKKERTYLILKGGCMIMLSFIILYLLKRKYTNLKKEN